MPRSYNPEQLKLAREKALEMRRKKKAERDLTKAKEKELKELKAQETQNKLDAELAKYKKEKEPAPAPPSPELEAEEISEEEEPVAPPPKKIRTRKPVAKPRANPVQLDPLMPQETERARLTRPKPEPKPEPVKYINPPTHYAQSNHSNHWVEPPLAEHSYESISNEIRVKQKELNDLQTHDAYTGHINKLKLEMAKRQATGEYFGNSWNGYRK